MKLYTKNICPKCLFVKFELDRHGFKYEEINMDKDEKGKQKILSQNIFAAPVLEFNGRFIADTKEITDFLEAKALAEEENLA